jgi:microcin C transport system substrate-binding protein
MMLRSKQFFAKFSSLRSGSLFGLFVALLAGCAVAATSLSAVAGEAAPRHGVSMHGDLKYPPDFAHFDYVNPDAPKGGEVRMAAIGTFDSFNPFILKGTPAAGVGLLFDTLTVQSDDEPFSQYGLIAETIEMPEDRSWVIFTLRPEARFHDDSPITAEDVIFSFETLRDEGQPFYRAYYANITEVEMLGPRRVKFHFDGTENRELPLIVGQLEVFSMAWHAEHPFNESSLTPLMGSGPYQVANAEAGRAVTYRRDPDYWAADLAVNRGRWNFDALRWDYYRDSTVALEAFKAHEFDFRVENSSKDWATGYGGKSFEKGLAVTEEILHEIPTGMQAYVFNTRKPMFRDPNARRALGYAFDFEWTNQTLFYGAYTRTRSYFSNSVLAATSLPDGAELALLEPLRDQLPEEVFTTVYEPPATDGSGNVRDNLRKASTLLKAAGWRLVDGKLTDPVSGAPMEIEFLLVQQSFERVIAPMVQNLAKLGVTANIRVVDSSQYQRRADDFDFDIIIGSYAQSNSPGNEQRHYWGSEFADVPGSRNQIGVRDTAVDALIDAIIQAPDRKALVAATRALDRVLLWGHYVVPHWHIRAFRVAYWNKFARPATPPKNALGFLDTWWVDPAKAQALAAGQSPPDAD